MSFNELGLKRIDCTVGELCRRSTRPECADRLRFECEIDSHTVSIWEVRLEAGLHSPWMSHLLAELGHDVYVTNPRRPRAIYRARIGHLDPALLFPLRHGAAQTQADLALLRSRAMVVKARGALIQYVRGVVMETNQSFIEAYMVGLNHEFARELLWREYPTDQRGSYFRQFWDLSSYMDTKGTDAETLRERLKDIPPLHRWSRFSHGHGLDVDKETGSLGAPDGVAPTAAPPLTQSFIPSAITFGGMPNTRWWTFEDGRTNFGDIKPDTTDLTKLLPIELGSVYANDWFLFPVTFHCGSIAQVHGLAVTNVFGERFWIQPAGKGANESWQRSSMYTLSVKGRSDVPAELSLLLLPSVSSAPDTMSGRPTPEVCSPPCTVSVEFCRLDKSLVVERRRRASMFWV